MENKGRAVLSLAIDGATGGSSGGTAPGTPVTPGHLNLLPKSSVELTGVCIPGIGLNKHIVGIVISYLDRVAEVMYIDSPSTMLRLGEMFAATMLHHPVMSYFGAVPESVEDYAYIFQCKKCLQYCEYISQVSGVCLKCMVSCSCTSGIGYKSHPECRNCHTGNCDMCGALDALYKAHFRGETFRICGICITPLAEAGAVMVCLGCRGKSAQDKTPLPLQSGFNLSHAVCGKHRTCHTVENIKDCVVVYQYKPKKTVLPKVNLFSAAFSQM